jgi:hypothetical protein
MRGSGEIELQHGVPPARTDFTEEAGAAKFHAVEATLEIATGQTS